MIGGQVILGAPIECNDLLRSMHVVRLRRLFMRKIPNGSCDISPARMRTKSSAKRWDGARRMAGVKSECFDLIAEICADALAVKWPKRQLR